MHIKKLQSLAKQTDLDIWFEDECHFQQHGSRCTMWIPPEETDPIVLHAPTRRKLGVFGAVCANDGRLVVQKAEKFCAQSFLLFLKKLVRRGRKGRKILVVLDNARWHHAILLRPWLQKQKRLSLDFLPPYSPELNHIERVWKLTRRLRTHNQYFQELEDLTSAVFDQFKIWEKPNETLKRLCAII